MSKIALLSQETIDKIAAGEVIERPSSVVKELVENAIDAGSTAITVEIKEGGISFIRITDNGSGIESSEVPLAFLRHSTSKIRSAEDLLCVHSLGFRGEALSSIAAIARVELITKTADALTGTRYLIEGSKEISQEEIGAPEGTTFLVRDLFYNTPARRKFLKTAQTEGTYISDMLEKLALSHPDISFKYINNNQTRLHTSGNGNRKDLIYHIYGREIASSLLEVNFKCDYFALTGFIGKPSINRGNRNYENYFINGRYIKSTVLSKAIEEAYKNFLINQEIYKELCDALYAVLSHRELIPEVPVTEEKKQKIEHVYKDPIPEPFEKRRINEIRSAATAVVKEPVASYGNQALSKSSASIPVIKQPDMASAPHPGVIAVQPNPKFEQPINKAAEPGKVIDKQPIAQQQMQNPTQVTLESISSDFLTKDAKKKHRIIGQLFKTYWLIEYEDKLYIIDQHAAHEKVLFERTMARLNQKEYTSQTISPPIVLSLDAKEQEMLEKYLPQIEKLGYEIENFGGREYMISAVPDNLFHIDMKDLFIEMLDDFSDISGRATPDLILEKVATMSCKAAVKGNDALSLPEIDALIEELLTLENPFNCPHGRPTIISMSKYEIEKKFKRIVT
ncbi:MAG: DNA mismatch repair protein MutL [Roseburia sp. CAG:197_41_10]|nr:MAG: DNA mismatch repair protein MutL [Roseburia sp. CAG:197_41_10]